MDKLNAMVSEFQERAPKICKDIEVDFECSIIGQFDPPAFDETCVNAVRSAAQELGYSYMEIVSGAGHDACWINDIAPTRNDHVSLRRWSEPQRGRRNL